MTISQSRAVLSGLSLTFPRLLSRLFSPPKAPFWTLRNSPRFRLLASDSPLCLAFVGYPLRNRHKLQSRMTAVFRVMRCTVPWLHSSLAPLGLCANRVCRAVPGSKCLDCLSCSPTDNSYILTRTQKRIAIRNRITGSQYRWYA